MDVVSTIHCRYYVDGRCKKGSACPFLHVPCEPTTANDTRKLVPCKFFNNGFCFRAEQCPYLHDTVLQGPKKQALCKYYLSGHCFKGQNCPQLHAEPGAVNGNECSICYTSLEESGKQFGLLSDCDHVFCLECIRKWKTAQQQSTSTCPVCRAAITFIIPSTIYATGEKKKEIEKLYRARIGTIPCKHFNFGAKRCPFGQDCLYGHFNPDGTKAITPPSPPRRKVLYSHEISYSNIIELFVRFLRDSESEDF
eukprot:TRINITY_DN2061_c0_g1_i3.p1 TRINITY_DN2061_c0_g1~~TRINITY_DN2061_c0_g1_i3.p1  ORF type:complete len:252 (-),score=18.02 TRINITY_DN2061_c0_g1_i3:265-1020(-)